MQSLFNNDLVEILFCADNKLIIQRWKRKYPLLPEFKEVVDKTVLFVKSYDITGLLSDATVQSVLVSDRSSYAVSSIPALMQNGMKRLAILLPKDIFFRHGVKNFTGRCDENIIRTFEEEDEAITWLKN